MSTAHAVPIPFTFDYSGEGANEGFNDPTLGARRKESLELAASRIGAVLERSYAGESIAVSARFDPLGGTATEAPIALGGFPFSVPTDAAGRWLGAALPGVPLGVPSTSYAPALANHVARRDLPLPAGTPSFEVQLVFNTDIDGAALGDSDFFYGDPRAGQGAAPAGDIDFLTLAMHEIVHGLGFFSGLAADGSYQGGRPFIFDRFLVNGDGDPLVGLTPAQRAAASTTEVVWNSEAGGGDEATSYTMYTPATFVALSSLVHLDPQAFDDALMSPAVEAGGVAVTRELSVPERVMLADIGWTVRGVPEPGSWLLLAAGLACWRGARRRGQGDASVGQPAAMAGGRSATRVACSNAYAS
ncbi:MAG: PEP-CTERM sorting domain-containing protein [Ectothiorhodospiraceae bacterium]|nr:PEP-CTERM sorting domain-containing protein [Chromatiales bacterium]MCP5157616.1 PEP-CTERM sorting domain-containing protein [Ectothiorhodospiraceae bacterium]